MTKKVKLLVFASETIAVHNNHIVVHSPYVLKAITKHNIDNSANISVQKQFELVQKQGNI